MNADNIKELAPACQFIYRYQGVKTWTQKWKNKLTVDLFCFAAETFKTLTGDDPQECGNPGCPENFLGCWYKMIKETNERPMMNEVNERRKTEN